MNTLDNVKCTLFLIGWLDHVAVTVCLLWLEDGIQVQCRCEDDKCTSNGNCLPGHKCALGYFGPKCQYKDLVQETTTNVSYLVDNVEDTCSRNLVPKRQNVALFRMQKAHTFTFMRLVVKQTNNIDEPYISVKLEFSVESSTKVVNCPGMAMWILSYREVDIFCELEKLFHSVKLTWASQFEVCEVHISAGRNVAIGSNVHTTSLFNTATDGNKAVDGDHQTCQMTAQGDNEPEIAILFYSPMVITRFRIFSRCENEAKSTKLIRNHTEAAYKIETPNMLVVMPALNLTSATVKQKTTIAKSDTTTAAPAKSNITSSASNTTSAKAAKSNTTASLRTSATASTTSTSPTNTTTTTTNTTANTATTNATASTTATQSTTTAATTTKAKTNVVPSASYHLMTYDANGKLVDTFSNTSLCHFSDIVLHNAVPISTLTLQMVPDDVDSKKVLSVCEFEAYGDCPTGHNGISCEEKCPINCKDRCSLVSGNCQNCARGRFGDRCTVSTPACGPYRYGLQCDKVCANCLHGACDIKGVCHFGCKPGYAGSRCTIACGYCALDGSCDQRTMVCKSGCLKRYFGTKCEMYCGNCKNATNCSMRLQPCPQGCIAPFAGLYCNETCGGCDKASGCDQLTHKCPNGCAPSFEGTYCKLRLRSAAVIETFRTDEKDSTSVVFILLMTFIFTFVAIFSVLSHLRQTTYSRRSS